MTIYSATKKPSLTSLVMASLRNFESLPKEVWIEVASYLDIDDLFALRLVSRELNSKICSRAVWRPRCYERWLKYENHDVMGLDRRNQSSGLSVAPSADWFYFFRFRYRIDTHLLRAMQKMKITTSSTIYWQTIWHLLRYNERIIPILRNFINEGYNSDTPFELTFTARQLLLTIRHGYVFKLIHDSFATDAMEFVHNAEETVFLPVAAMDPCFDRLLTHRSRLIEEVHYAIKERFSDLTDFLQLPSTLKVDKLVKFIFESLKRLQLSHVHQRSRYYVEDFMLLRVYAGETKGHILLLLSIVQSISAKYNVETILCEEFLIIRDLKLRGGETYLTISQAGKPRIFTRRNLVDSMCRIFPSRQVVIDTIIPKVLTPLKLRDLLFKVFDEWYPYCKKSMWSVIPDKTANGVLLYLPQSRYPMSTPIYEYFQAYWKLNQLGNGRAILSAAKHQFSDLLLKNFPQDVAHLRSSDGYDTSKMQEIIGKTPFKDVFKSKYNISFDEDCNVGEFVTGRDDQLLIVLGGKQGGNNVTYLNVMNLLGQVNVELKDELHSVEWNVRRRKEVIDLLKVLSSSDLGLFFTRLDRESNRLIPSFKLLDCIKNS